MTETMLCGNGVWETHGRGTRAGNAFRRVRRRLVGRGCGSAGGGRLRVRSYGGASSGGSSSGGVFPFPARLRSEGGRVWQMGWRDESSSRKRREMRMRPPAPGASGGHAGPRFSKDGGCRSKVEGRKVFAVARVGDQKMSEGSALRPLASIECSPNGIAGMPGKSESRTHRLPRFSKEGRCLSRIG